MENQSPAFASNSSMDHVSFRSSFAPHNQVADMGNHCPEGCVHVTHSAVVRRGTFIMERVILRLLTHAHCLVASSVDHCVVRCALLKQRTCARVSWRIVFFTPSTLYLNEVFGRFRHVFHTFARSLIYWLYKATRFTTVTWRCDVGRCASSSIKQNQQGSRPLVNVPDASPGDAILGQLELDLLPQIAQLTPHLHDPVSGSHILTSVARRRCPQSTSRNDSSSSLLKHQQKRCGRKA